MTALVWTAADEAELDVLAHELVRLAWPLRHKRSVHGAISEAVEAILEWRQARELRSIAAKLRAGQDFAEWAA